MINNNKRTEQLLEDIKNLIILVLHEKEATGKRISEILDVDPAVVSRILSRKKPKK